MSGSAETLTADGILRAAIDFERFPWIRPLVAAYTHQFSSVAPLFAGDPADPAAWRDTIARVTRAPRDRAAIAAIVARQLASRRAPDAAVAGAAHLGDPRAVAIVTGQQAGVFGGPLYTLLKAITTIQLARQVQKSHGVPVVPIFWVEAEDHDWQEVRATSVLDGGFDLREVTLSDLAGAGSQPAGSLALDEGAHDAIAELQAALAPTEFTAEVVAALSRRYCPGATMATAFAGVLDDLLGHLGLVVVDAGDPAAKPLVSKLFVHELSHPGESAGAVRDAAAAMTRLGHTPQIEPESDAVGLFYLNDAGRTPIKGQDGHFVIGDVVHTREALVAEAQAHPERFSPNVVLRPLVQDTLFPTACYVGGPSELAYQAELGGVYRAFGVERPLLYSRASATVLDSAAARFLERYPLPFEALHAQDDAALNEVLEAQLPPALDRTLADAEAHLTADTDALRGIVVTIDPTLAGAVDTTRDRLRDTLKTLHNKIVQASKRKDETLRRQFHRTRALAFPGGAPQERTLSLAFFINRYGPAIADRLLETLPLDTGQHYVLTP
jgi:bacillithiol biosynthesis cysteine-adding enzyme BshC